MSMASGYPLEVGQELVDDFHAYGFDAELVPLFWENRESAAADVDVLRRLEHYGSFFFSGGDQSRIVQTLVQNGEETPALRMIRRCHEAGGLVAGTSAGAAIMSGPMIVSGTSLNALSAGLCEDDDNEDGFRLGRGLDFFRWGLVDQHFLQRGRIGRVLAASRELGQPLAFGVDENSALLVDGNRGRVVGETGVMLVDLRKARTDEDYDLRGVRVSYLDDGDEVDLARGKPRPAADKKRVRVGRGSYRRPAPVRRPAFASYAVHDLLLRLVEGDPAYYRQDSALAYDEDHEVQVSLELERLPRRSRALRAVRDGEIRYSAIGFELRLKAVPLPLAQRPVESPMLLPPDPAPEARLVLLGNSPLDWGEEPLSQLRPELQEPVGILATASGEPHRVAARYLEWLRGLGLDAEILDISLSNIERASRDRSLLRRLGAMGSLLFTGGDQRRLTETLLHCAEATPVLHAVVSAYERGVPLIGVAAAASAFANSMIADGDSAGALRHGSSEDAGFSGVVVEQGIGLIAAGLIDQNFLERRRLGRLLVACAARRQRFGFGLCEESGLVIGSAGERMWAIGRAGIIVAALESEQVTLVPPHFSPAGIRLFHIEPGQSFSPAGIAAETPDYSGAGLALLERAVGDLVRDYNRGTPPGSQALDAQSLQAALVQTPAADLLH